jgi:putative transposase
MTARKRIRCLIDDCHRKAAKWLCSNYRVILLPSYESSNMVKKKNSRISKKTARSMYNWSHYGFKINLLNNAKQFKVCMVSVVNESYTSVTCGKCGYQNQYFTDKNFHCNQCRFIVDRDVNGCS